MRWSLPAFFNLHAPGGLAILNGEVTRQGTMISYDAVFAGLAIVCLLLAPFLLLLKPSPPLPPDPKAEIAAE